MRAISKRLLLVIGYFCFFGLANLFAAPANDDPCNATILDVNIACTYATFNNDLATASTGPAAPGCGNYVGADVWFQVTMPNNGYHIQIDLQSGTLTDMAMAVYSGADCNNLTLLSCDDNSGNGNMPTLTIDDECLFAQANATYWVRVWDEGGDESGNFDICASAVTPAVPGGVVGCGSDPVTGNSCCDAILLTDGLDGYCGNTGGYTPDPAIITGFFCANIENNSWIAFIAAEPNVEIGISYTNCNNGNGIQSLIYETSDCNSFQMVSDDCWNPGPGGATSGSLTGSNLTPGETYYLMIDGWNGDVCDYTLSIVSGVLTSSATASDTIICSGQTTTLSANVYGVGPYTYSWAPTGSLDDPTIATPIASPTGTTTYSVTVTSPTETIVESVEVTVDQTSPGSGSISGPTSVCENASGIVYTASSTFATEYAWTVTGSASIVGSSNDAILTVDWGMSGGTVCMTPSNKCGGAAEVCINVAVVAAPEISATDPPNGCAPGTVNLAGITISNNTGGIGLITFYNTYSDAQNGVNMLPSPQVSNPGTYWVRMDTGTDCFDVTSVTVTIEDPQIVVVDPQPVCSPTTIDLDTDVFKNEVNGWSGGTYTYFTDSLQAVNEQNELTNTAVSTMGTYWIRYETAAGCFDVAGVFVNIEEAPDVSANEQLYICVSESVDISTASITDANNATIISTYYFTTESFADLGWPALAMSSTVVNTPATYYARYETAAGCWDTAHIVVLSTATPDAVLSGGGTLCSGDDGTLTFTISGTPPFDLVYNNGTTDITLPGISSPYDEVVTINADTDFNIVSVSDAGSCPGTFSGTASFTTSPTPTFSLSGDASICEGADADLTFNMTGNGPFYVVYNDGTDITLTGIPNGHTITVSPGVTTTYTPVSISDAGACPGTVATNATISIYSSIEVINLQETCNGINTEYTVSFQLTGGEPSSYQVAGAGSFDNGTNTFTSNTLTSGATYSFSVSDANCGPVIVDGIHACDCTSQAGTMGNSQKLVCESATVTMNYDNGEVLDANDELGFILYSDQNDPLGSIVMTNTSPVFIYTAALNFEQVYYVSAIVGNDDGSGFPVLDNTMDPCLSISNGQSLTFFQETIASISAPGLICEGETTQLTFNLTGNSIYNVEYTDGTTTFELTGISDGHTVDVTPTGQVTYTINQVSNTNVPFCNGAVPPGGNTVTINLSQQPTISNLIEDCDNQNVNYTISFEINGGDPSGYDVIGGGTLNGNLFTSDPIPEGNIYSFEVGDGICPAFTVTGDYSCDCITAVGSMENTSLMACDDETVTATYDNNEVLDSDDVLGFVLHDTAGAPLGNIYATNSTPMFSYLPALTYGVTYYVSAVVGNDDGTGFPVLDQSQDACLSISNGQPVAFFIGTEVSITGESSICVGETAEIIFGFSTPGLFDVTYTDGFTSSTLTGITDGYTLPVMPSQTTTYTLMQVSNNAAPFCPGELTQGSSEVTISVSEGPSLSNMIFECDDLSVNYTLTFDVTGGNTANYAVVGLNGTLTGSTFVSDPMPGGTAFAFQVNDGGPCPVEEVGEYFCNCFPDMQPILNIEESIGCGGQSNGALSVTPFSGTAPYTYTWSNNAIGTTINGLSIGWHHVTMTDAFGCTAVDSIYLDEPTAISAELSATDPDCYGGDNATISINNVTGGSGVYSFSLSVLTSFQGNTFYDLKSGYYEVTVEDDRGCIWSDSIYIDQPDQFMVSTMDDQNIRLGDSIALEVFTNAPLDTFYWSPLIPSDCPECLTQFVYPSETITFTLTAVNENGCLDTDRLTVNVTKENPVYIPNAFSPNADGINDFLNIYTSISVSNIKTFNVYTRWGELLYAQENFLPNLEDMGWNGYFKGRAMSSGVYVYYVEIEYVDGTSEIVRGDVTLIK